MAELSPSVAPPTGAAPSPAASPPRISEPPAAEGGRRFTEILVRIAVLAAAAVIIVLFATQWDRWVGGAIRRSRTTPMSAATSRRFPPRSKVISGMSPSMIFNGSRKVTCCSQLRMTTTRRVSPRPKRPSLEPRRRLAKLPWIGGHLW